MEKNLVYLIVLLSLSITFFALYKLDFLRITGLFIGFRQSEGEFKWWNVSWNYRFKLEINSTQYTRTDWPVEKQINFTDLIPSGTFDENSIRVIEYSSSGDILYEVPSQFDKDIAYSSANNAIGTLVFLLNGTTQPNTVRYFEIYYDTAENGAKSNANYGTDLVYDNSTLTGNGEFSVNNTYYKLIFDTTKGENTSGFYYAESGTGLYAGLDLVENDKTLEYLQYSNGTNNFMFDLRNKANFLSIGPIRIIVEQTGDESFWNDPDSVTGKGIVVKRYIFYKNSPWIKVIQNFTNIDSSNITRNSTEAGALAFDASRAWSGGYKFGIGTDQENQTNPSDNTWGWASSAPTSSGIVGIINVNQTGTANFWLTDDSSFGRIGIQLNSTNITAGGSITHTAAFYFNETWYVNAVEDLKNMLANPISITDYLPETWYVEITPSTNATIYNRNETVLVTGNVFSGDAYNLTRHMNATFDMGTPSPSDDQTIVLDETQDKVFTGIFNISNDATIGIWTVNLTAYSNNTEYLNSTTITFNVTDVLDVTVIILNKKPMVNSIVFANIYVKNYRQDSWISGATINCSYDSSEVTNKTDHNNGTYSVNFTAPGTEGNSTLVCNATKDGNFGNNTDTFTTEPAQTYVDIAAEPSNPVVSNVTLYYNDSFTITANATNLANGTAYSTNITLELLSGWDANTTLEECGDIERNNYCTKNFNLIVPNGTTPGNYYINVTAIWKNPDNTISSNRTQVNVTVQSNPRINVEETKVSGETGDGIWTIVGNFTVSSIGNDALQDITFSCISGDVCNNFIVGFIPEDITSLAVRLRQGVSINVTVPLGYTPGTYNGTINVSTQNNGFDTFTLETIVPAKTNVSTTTNITNYISRNITQQSNETFSFKANSTNVGNGSARFINISLILPSGWTSNPSLEICGNLTKNSTCTKEFNVTIPKATVPGSFLINVSSNWTQPDNSLGTNRTSINVTVTSNPSINVTEINVSGTIPDGTERTLGNFTVLSIGNDALQNINFNCYSGIVCQNFTVEFIPSSISSLAVNSNQSVMVNVTVPLSYAAGTYNGIVNVSAGNDNYKNLTLEVTISPNRTWGMQPDYCQRSQNPAEGLVCEVNVSNRGNIYINFTISPEQGNYTQVNETNFTINAQNSHVFSVTYNVTTAPSQVHNSTFIIDAVETDANPDNSTLRISLLPYIEPIINISIVPNETEQQNNVEIYVNITDRSSTGISWAKINITKPNSTIGQFNLNKTSESGNLTTWYFLYSSGNTTQTGNYNITVYTEDNIGNTGMKNATFLIYKKLSVSVSTLTSVYYQGDTGSIYYIVRDLSGTGVSNVNTTFTIKDSYQNVTHLSVHTSNQDGIISPLPSFSLFSDTPLGTYTLISNSTYFDNTTNKILQISTNASFQVLSRTVTVTGLFADIETAIVWYPDNVMKFGILVYNGEGRPVDPTSINLTVNDPAGNLYFTASLSQMTKQTTGFYTYSYAMPGTTPTGMFLAVLNASQNELSTLKLKAFRVARGGPYDIWLDLLENEVQRGDYLDFAITIENKGEVSQDVNLEWWVSSGNTTYYQESGWALTPALTNQTVTKQAYIYSNQPLGTYILNLRMIYDNIQAPLVANSTFVVLSQQINITTTTVPATTITYPYYPSVPTGAAVEPKPTPTEKISADILIEKYGTNISLVRGMTMIESVTIRNTGKVDLNNVSFFIIGIPTIWFNITPESYKNLKSDESAVFLINFNIPQNAQLGEHRITLIAMSGVVSNQKPAVITIFQSLEELLEDELNKIKEDLQELMVDVKVAEREGKDVSGVLLYVDEIKTQINLTENNLKNGKTEDALENIANAKNLLSKARDLLSKLELLKIKGLLPLPSWSILIILVLVISITITVFFLRRMKMLPSLRPYIIPIGKLVERTKEKPKEDFAKEKEKLLRMLEVLDKEKEEGIISNVAYKEMKKSVEEKLKKIEKKLR
jgi:uncharacterized membrane protein